MQLFTSLLHLFLQLFYSFFDVFYKVVEWARDFGAGDLGGLHQQITWRHGHICCESLPTSTHMALILGIFVLYILLSCIGSPCNLLFLNLGVQLFSHVPTVTVWMLQ